MKSTREKAITLIALIITIIILLILAGVTVLTLTSENGILKRSNNAGEETKKQTATEMINLKITDIQVQSYAKNKELPSLQYLADKLCEDDEMEYVLKESKKDASLEKIDVTSVTSIYTKLKDFPYEFEINSSLQLASIDGVEIADVKQNLTSGLSYENLNIKFDDTKSSLKYFYGNKEILPIYWYGLQVGLQETLSPWYETYNVPTITKNEKSFVYSAYMAITWSQCVGGLTTGFPIDLGKYNECHMIVNNSNVTTLMQFVSYTGAMGGNLGNEGANIILQMDAVDNGPVEYVGDISKVTGTYYMGLQSWNAQTNMEIAAWWLE